MCIEIERGVCRERQRGPVTVKVWPRIGVRVRVSCILFSGILSSGILSVHLLWHFVRASFLAFCRDTVKSFQTRLQSDLYYPWNSIIRGF